MQKHIHALTQCITYITALVPVFVTCAPCPTCMPIYAAILSFFGLKLADYSIYLMPIMLSAMTVSLVSVYRQAQQKQASTLPSIMILLAYIALFYTKFYLKNQWLVYITLIVMMGASSIHHINMRSKNCDHSCKQC